MTGTLAIVLFVVLLVGAIMLHEWGHFATARHFGMRADRFFLGFGPTIWSTRVGETEYGVKAIPAGGFVRIKGMTPADERLRPVADAVFDPELVAADRRAMAEATRTDLLEVPALTELTWARFRKQLKERGTPRPLVDGIATQVQDHVGVHGTPVEARHAAIDAIEALTEPGEGTGTLRHRLLRGDAERFFHDKPAWQRAIVLVAGSVMHFLIAVVLLLGGYLLIPQPTGEASATILEFSQDSPAELAGLVLGDEIVSVGGTRSADFEVLREVIRANPTTTLDVVVVRDGEEATFTVTTGVAEDTETGEEYGILGFLPAAETERLSAGDALWETFVGPASVPATTVASVKALGAVFGPEGIGQLFAQVSGEAARDVDGGISLIGAGGVTGQGVQIFGVMFLIGMLASINVFIGVFNMLPLPPLDGGHLAVLGVEKSVNVWRRIRGQAQDFTVDPRAVAAVALPVIVIFGTVALALIWLDITNPIQL